MNVREPLLNQWYKALSAEIGIELICANPEAIRSKLYTVRKEAKDTDLDGLAVCSSPFDPTRLWIIRKEKLRDAT